MNSRYIDGASKHTSRQPSVGEECDTPREVRSDYFAVALVGIGLSPAKAAECAELATHYFTDGSVAEDRLLFVSRLTESLLFEVATDANPRLGAWIALHLAGSGRALSLRAIARSTGVSVEAVSRRLRRARRRHEIADANSTHKKSGVMMGGLHTRCRT